LTFDFEIQSTFEMKKIKEYRSRLLTFLTHGIALPLITRFRNNPEFPYTMNDLMSLPDGTLGKDLANYLTSKKFTLLRNYERHDCKHIILQFEMDEVGEACMQYYFFGNRRYSLPVLSTVLVVTILMPEHWSKFYKEFKRGRRSPSFRNVDFVPLVLLPTEKVRQQFVLPY
jgi:hypothetical protein